jgi:cytoskeletal protein CcmA (bactofilin family)
MAAGKSPFSVIGTDVVITGDVRAGVDLHIDGTVEGDIGCVGLVQGAESRIIGQITARSARLCGTIEGSINVGELVIESTARITGDVTYESISIATGSQVDGRFTHRSSAGTADLKLVRSEGAQEIA